MIRFFPPSLPTLSFRTPDPAAPIDYCCRTCFLLSALGRVPWMSDGAGVRRPLPRGSQLLSCGWQVALCDGRCSKARYVTGHHHHRLHHCLDFDPRTSQNAVSFFLLSLGDLSIVSPQGTHRARYLHRAVGLHTTQKMIKKAPCPCGTAWSPRRLSHLSLHSPPHPGFRVTPSRCVLCP